MHRECLFCGSAYRVTAHHLIPRTVHRNKWFKKRYAKAEMQQTIALCQPCHRQVHTLVPDEKELGRLYNTPQALLAHEGVAKFIAWRRKR